MKLLIASSNPHKVQEIIDAFVADAGVGSSGDLPVEVVGLDSLGRHIPEPTEDQPTFEGNASIKARYYAQATGSLVLAEDSGLEVDALDGEPGVRSARYSGTKGVRGERDLANNRLLLQRLNSASTRRRTARFVCAMVMAGASEECTAEVLDVVRGVIEGRILRLDEVADPRYPENGRGKNGFGYDPLFLVPHLDMTTAELTPEQKNTISHRGQAARRMWPKICQRSDH